MRIWGLLLLAVTGRVQGQDYQYKTNGNAITIAKYIGTGGAVAIPEQITGLPVANIGYWAFGFCTNLTNVTLPNSVTSIGSGAFDHCANLIRITIPSSVTAIGIQAFSGCSHLTSITIPNSVTNIADEAFRGCTNLTGIYFKGNAPSLGSAVFADADKVTVYYLSESKGWTEMFGYRRTAVWKP